MDEENYELIESVEELGTNNSKEEEEIHELAKSFKELGVCEPLINSCTKLGWITPTEIQHQAVPHALQGKDIIGLAQTGSGKTGAFVLPIIQALMAEDSLKPFFGCVISPTRELAIQIAELFGALGADIGLKTAALVGGVDMNQQQSALAEQPHIIVATPDRLMDHLSNTNGFSLHTLKYLVLDEADRLLDGDFEKAIDDILKAIPPTRRTFLFSPTMTENVKKLQSACLRNPVMVGSKSKRNEAALKKYIPNTLKQQYLFVPAKYKDCYLVYILVMMARSTMIFARTRITANVLALMLHNLGFKAVHIHAELSKAQRNRALEEFESGERNILICTDVMIRGLDTGLVDMVINYDLPSSFQNYAHRLGRTARAMSAVGISLVNEYDVELFVRIEKVVGNKITKYPAEEEDVLLLYERVSEANRIALKQNKESLRSKKRNFKIDDEQAGRDDEVLV